MGVPKATDKQVQLSAEKESAAHFGCTKACRTKHGVDSHCVSACETAYSQCNDVTCQKAALAKYEKSKGFAPPCVQKKKKEEKKAEKGGKKEAKKEEKKKEKKSALIGTPKGVDQPLQLSAEEQKKHAHFGCVDACRPDCGAVVSSQCVIACEAEYMQCLHAECQAKVLAK